ncbi:MAG: peptidylprolyl isomerase [Gemmatimonadota bacterium]
MNLRHGLPAIRRILLPIISMAMFLPLHAHAQQTGAVDRARLERLLIAEDSRGKGTSGIAPIMEGLTSRDTLIRRVAVRALGRLQRPDLAAHLVPVLSDSIPAVRSEAAIAMAQGLRGVRRGSPDTDSAGLTVTRALQALNESIVQEKNDSVAGAMAEALGRLPLGDSVAGRRAEHAILTRAGSTLNFGMAHGLFWLAATRRFSGGLSQPAIVLLRATSLTAADTLARRISILALGAAAALDSSTMFAAFQDRDEQVRRLALAGAAALSPGDRVGLVRQALTDRSMIVRVAAIGAARAGNDRPDCGPIIGATRDPHSYVVLTAIDALGAPCGDSAAVVAALLEIIQRKPAGLDESSNRGWQAAAHALVALSRVDSTRANLALGSFVTSRRWQNRLYAATAAANLSAIEPLMTLARDKDHNVREAAIAGLSKVKKHDADSLYIAGLASDGFQVVLASAQALAGSHHPDAVRALLDGMDRLTARRSENARDPRLAILTRVGEMGSAADSARLTTYLADFDTTVATTSAAILSRWTGRRIEPRPAPLPITPEPLATIFLDTRSQLKVTMAASSGGGSFTLRLFPRETPATVARIVRLARQHFYDGHVFQRVEPNFVIQGGGPDASEYVGHPDFMRDEVGFHSHNRGTAGISSRGRDTGDAQLFLNLVDNPLLDHEFTVFGQVTGGLAVMDQIVEGDTIAKIEVIEGR